VVIKKSHQVAGISRSINTEKSSYLMNNGITVKKIMDRTMMKERIIQMMFITCFLLSFMIIF